MPEIAIGWRFSSQKKLGPWDLGTSPWCFLVNFMTSVCQDGLLFVGDELLGSGCYGNAELAMEIAMENGSFSGVICPKKW